MRSIQVFALTLGLMVGLGALADQKTQGSMDVAPSVECSLSYYQRAARWEDDVDIVSPYFVVSSSTKTDEIRGFRAEARFVTVCAGEASSSCREELRLHLSLSKGESEVESINGIESNSSGPWTVQLKVGRFEQATLLCSGRRF
ncbi:MAG: hypothetical protein AB7F86_05295 [Bdellovibrionales bacterium]